MYMLVGDEEEYISVIGGKPTSIIQQHKSVLSYKRWGAKSLPTHPKYKSFYGSIQGLVVFNRALSNKELTSLYVDMNHPLARGLVGAWGVKK